MNRRKTGSVAAYRGPGNHGDIERRSEYLVGAIGDPFGVYRGR
jgi:hypothetical protein